MRAKPGFHRILLVAGATTALALTFAILPSTSAQEFKLTSAKDIAANPHRYWARGVVFRDTLISAPSQTQTKIADRVAFPFTTEILGTCHATAEIAPVIRELAPQKEYIFTATVYSESRGLIRKRTIYRFLVDGVVAPASDVGELTQKAASHALTQRAENDAYAMRLRTLHMLVARVQEFSTVISASEGIERDEMFDPASENFEKLIAAARRAVNDLEKDSGVPGREHLAQILVALVALAENRVHSTHDEERPLESPASSPDLPAAESLDPISPDVPVEPAAPEPHAEDKLSAEPQESDAPRIEHAAPPATERPADEPLPRQRARRRALKDAKTVPSTPLRLEAPMPAPVIEKATETLNQDISTEAVPAQPESDQAQGDETKISAPSGLEQEANEKVDSP